MPSPRSEADRPRPVGSGGAGRDVCEAHRPPREQRPVLPLVGDALARLLCRRQAIRPLARGGEALNVESVEVHLFRGKR